MKIEPNQLRKHVLKMVFEKKSGHIGGSFSIAELVAYLYSNFDLLKDGRDKLILSKGHAVPILYAALYELGCLNNINDFREINSPLQGHPDKERLSYIHATTGALGQGLSIAIGHAIACKLKKLDNNIFCILGDGETQEGQIWEAFMLAPKYKLDNLICFVDSNGAQNDGYVKDILNLGDLESKIKPFGWETYTINGHNLKEISNTMKSLRRDGRPICIVLNTIKGKGVSFMENAQWHAKVPTNEEYLNALLELDNESNS